MGLLMNVDDGRKYNGFVVIEDGEARVSLPAGHYSGVFDWAGTCPRPGSCRSGAFP